MPVPLSVYAEQVKRQSIRNTQITREQLTTAMGHLVLPADLLSHLGPAVGAGRSILMYGPPGNGKSSISNGIRDALGDKIYVPRAIAYSGQVITVYDPVVHSAAEDDVDDPTSLRRTSGRFDTRYIRCERPTVITGGELSLSMLDLVYNPTARTYQAPLQMKSTGGIFIVDDLGRQTEPPQMLVNRWIVPLEENRVFWPCNRARNSKCRSTRWSCSRPTFTPTRSLTRQRCGGFSTRSRSTAPIRKIT